MPWKSPHYHWADVAGIANDDDNNDADDDYYNGDDENDDQDCDEDDNDDDGGNDYNDNDDDDDRDKDEDDDDYDNGNDDDNHDHDEDDDVLLWKRRENEWQIMIVLKNCLSCITINQLVHDVTFECDSLCLHLWICLRNRKTKRVTKIRYLALNIGKLWTRFTRFNH